MSGFFGGIVQALQVMMVAVVAVVNLVMQPFVGNSGPAVVPLQEASVPPAVETVTIATAPYADHESPIVVGSAGQTLYIHGTAQDLNGCQTITTVTLEFYPTTAGGCSGNINCVTVSAPTLDQCTTSETRVRYQFALSVPPPNAAQGWTAHVVANDGAAVGSGQDEATLQPGAGGPYPTSLSGPTMSPTMPINSMVATTTPLPTSTPVLTPALTPTATPFSSTTGPSYWTLPEPTATP